MARNKYGPRNPTRVLNLAVQDSHVKRRFPLFSCMIHGGYVVWRGYLQPRLTSPQYQIEIRYNFKKTPKVWVISPPVIKGAPHIFREGNLCLYWPPEWSWKPDQLIAKTIIPWTASWLFYYELWLDTSKWLGPSSHIPLT